MIELFWNGVALALGFYFVGIMLVIISIFSAVLIALVIDRK